MTKEKIKEIGDNLIEYIVKMKPNEVFIDSTVLGLLFYEYINKAIKRQRIPTKLIRIFPICSTDGIAFRKD